MKSRCKWGEKKRKSKHQWFNYLSSTTNAVMGVMSLNPSWSTCWLFQVVQLFERYLVGYTCRFFRWKLGQIFGFYSIPKMHGCIDKQIEILLFRYQFHALQHVSIICMFPKHYNAKQISNKWQITMSGSTRLSLLNFFHIVMMQKSSKSSIN